MATIFIDASALMIAGGAAAARGVAAAARDCTPRDDAARMVGHLLTSGHQVMLLGAPDEVAAAQATMHPRWPVQIAPADWPEGTDGGAAGWLVTDSPARCAAKRAHPRLRTVLVEASSRWQDLAHRPADLLARSLRSAVLDILASEAQVDLEAAPPPAPIPQS